MSKSSDLMAFGAPAQLAGAIQGDTVNNLVAAGTTQANALALTAVNNIVVTAAAATGVRLQAGLGQGDTVVVANLGANALLVYPPTGGSIQAGAANAALSVPTLKTATFGSRDGNNNFYAVLSA